MQRTTGKLSQRLPCVKAFEMQTQIREWSEYSYGWSRSTIGTQWTISWYLVDRTVFERTARTSTVAAFGTRSGTLRPYRRYAESLLTPLTPQHHHRWMAGLLGLQPPLGCGVVHTVLVSERRCAGTAHSLPLSLPPGRPLGVACVRQTRCLPPRCPMGGWRVYGGLSPLCCVLCPGRPV